MAGVVEKAIATWSGGTGYSRVDIWEAGRDNNAGWVDVGWWVGSRGTWAGISGSWDWSRYGFAGNASGSVGAATGVRGIQSGTTRVYCDANGNYSNYGIGMWWDMYYGQGAAESYIQPGRSAKAPTNNAPTASNISVVTARINGSVSSNGWGTSSSYDFRYRKQGSSTWTERGFGGNTWNLSGLTPGTTYEMAQRSRNNNNDTTGWTPTYTFTTLPAPNTSEALLRIVGVK